MKNIEGIKFSKIEQNCMIGHGTSITLREHCFFLSDSYVMLKYYLKLKGGGKHIKMSSFTYF
uniref:Uncharacterized protein n=2 Tax=Physcomitrium patens TaxID=3218 RepID=A0A7I4FL69_PHYPA